MNVGDTWEVHCPQCGGEHQIDVAITTWARFTSDSTDLTEAMFQDTEWDGDSDCVCHGCGHSGKARDFAKPVVE